MSQARAFWLVMSAIFLMAGFIIIDTVFTQTSAAMARRQPGNASVMEKTFSSAELTFKYPVGYTVASKELDSGKPVITVSGPAGRLAIFKQSNYPSGGGPTWIFPYFSEKIKEYLPTQPSEQLSVGSGAKAFGVWLFYSTSNSADAKSALHDIVKTIKPL